MTLSLNAVYNLKAVLKETGIKPDVLRAWERRYGVPMPQRTAGGHRLYSEHDIEIIKWLLARQNDGLSISNAVDMWKEKMVGGRDPLGVPVQNQNLVPAIVPNPSISLSIPSVSLTGMDEIRSGWLKACMAFNELAAEQILNQAFAIYPVEMVCTSVLQWGVAEIGSMWYQNTASIQQEHFTSALALRRLDALMMASPAPTRPYNLIMGCPANEWHTFTPMLLALLVRRRGFNVIYLGANVPANYFVETIDAVNANLVVLAAQQLNTAASLQHAVSLIAAHGTHVAFGGRIFSQHPDLVTRISGHYLGNRLEDAINVIDGLLLAPSAMPMAVGVSKEYEQALKAFILHRAFIETMLDRRLGKQNFGVDNFFNVHKYLGDNIVAALSLGNMAYVDPEIDWVKNLKSSLNLPDNLLSMYLEMYADAVRQHLAKDAIPLFNWFESQLSLLKTGNYLI